MNKRAITLFTNLYPNPWQPNRATFNKQQYNELESVYKIKPIVPIPWLEYFKNRKTIKSSTEYKHVLYFPFFYVPGLFRRLNALFMTLSILVNIKPAIALKKSDTVIASWAFPDGVACGFLSRVFSFKLYIQCLGSDVNFHSQQAFKRRQLQSAFNKAKSVITVSNALENKVREIAPNAKVVTAYNGVNFNKFSLRPKYPKSYKLTFIGNLIKTKGVYELIDAIEVLIKKNPRYKLQIIGAGPERGGLEQACKEKQIGQSVTFCGSVAHDQVVGLLKTSDMLVLPSYREGIPNVIMESLACGIPVVATKVGGIPEVVTPINGVLIDTYSPDLIVGGILECHSKNWEPEQIRSSISQYTWSANREQIVSILESTQS